MRKIITVVVLFAAFLQPSKLMAQDLLKGNDLSTVRVDYLSDGDIAKIKTQLQSNSVSVDQLESMVLSKGMSSTEFAKLKKRLALPEGTKAVANKKTTKKKSKDLDSEEEEADDAEDALRRQEKIENKKVKDSLNSLVFGSDLFDNPTLNFEPNLKLATPVNYVLGPGDELQVSIYGVQEFNASIPVSVEGKVSIQYVGEIPVSGMTIEAATQKIRAAIARVYSTVASGQSQVGVSLSRIRTIKVTLIGSKQPGNYSVSSLATVYNALFLGGGPGKNGSYRNIELIRNNKVFKNIDIYRFLVKGDQSDNVGLKDNDVIRIPAYTHRVTVEGEVKRPGIFEMKGGETFADLLSFASGFNEIAYTASVNLLQKTAKEFKVRDIKAAEYNSYRPFSGDVFRVGKILNRFENRIKIEGAVFRPDTYSFYEGMRISDLVAKADGLKEDAYLKRARIIRLKEDLTTEAVHVDLAKAMNADASANIELKKEDQVTVYSILDFKEEYKVTIDGEVKNPAIYDFQDKLTLNDLIVTAGGLTGSASKRVEIARMVRSEAIDEKNPDKVELFTIEINPASNEQASHFELKPFDVVNIRRMASSGKPEMVSISGAVSYPGKYVLASKKEKIYSILQRAGGLSSLASLNGVKVKRPVKKEQIEALKNVDLNLEKKEKKDSISKKIVKQFKKDSTYVVIPINWNKISKNQNSTANITLMPGDEIEVSSFNETVKVVGNVLLNSEIPYKKGKGFSYYLDAVGGIDAKGWRRKAYVIYPNGEAAVSHNYVLFRSNPKVVPGSQIVVPEKPERHKLTTGDIVSIGSVISSFTLLLITVFRR